MPRKLGRIQNAALREIVQRAPSLRSTIDRARQNAGRTGSVITELNRLAARGQTNATSVLDLMRRGGARTGGSGSSGG